MFKIVSLSSFNAVIKKCCLFLVILTFFSKAFSKTDYFPKKEAYSKGESITITPTQKNNVSEKYMLWYRFNDGSWEVATDPFSGPLKYTFEKDGLYSLQINTLDKSGSIVDKYWLGQFYVGPLNVKYVENVSWRPMKVTFTKGEKLNFLFSPVKSIPLQDLEFQVLTQNGANNEWKEAIAWHSWPLPEFVYSESVPLAIAINVRKKASFLATQKIFIGNFLPQNISFKRDDFLSAILSHHRNPDLKAKLLTEAVSEELNLATHLLYWTYLKLSIKDKVARAKSLGSGFISKGSKIYFTTSDNVSLVADLRSNSITDGMITISIDSNSHPYLHDIFSKLNKLPDSVKMASLLVNFLYNHYNYSQVPDRFNRPFLGLRDTNSMCNLNAAMLKNILHSLGFKVTAISFANYDNEKHQLVASHAINELFINNQYYVLDATTNRIGHATPESIIKTKIIPKFIILPQAFDAEIMYKFPITSIGKISETEIDRI